MGRRCGYRCGGDALEDSGDDSGLEWRYLEEERERDTIFIFDLVAIHSLLRRFMSVNNKQRRPLYNFFLLLFKARLSYSVVCSIGLYSFERSSI